MNCRSTEVNCNGISRSLGRASLKREVRGGLIEHLKSFPPQITIGTPVLIPEGYVAYLGVRLAGGCSGLASPLVSVGQDATTHSVPE